MHNIYSIQKCWMKNERRMMRLWLRVCCFCPFRARSATFRRFLFACGRDSLTCAILCKVDSHVTIINALATWYFFSLQLNRKKKNSARYIAFSVLAKEINRFFNLIFFSVHATANFAATKELRPSIDKLSFFSFIFARSALSDRSF